jgi:hypothetical protein
LKVWYAPLTYYYSRSSAPKENKPMQKQKETETHGAALDRNTPRSTSIGGHSKSVADSIEDTETPLDITQRVLNTLPEEFQSKARRLAEKGLVRITGET